MKTFYIVDDEGKRLTTVHLPDENQVSHSNPLGWLVLAAFGIAISLGVADNLPSLPTTQPSSITNVR
jgi:hypothetical protein